MPLSRRGTPRSWLQLPDLQQGRRSLYRSLRQVTTLVTGPLRSGKELVAEAIKLSRYIPSVPKQGKFAIHPDESYFAVNISALSRNLVESEIFGHAKGAFTDAAVAGDRSGKVAGRYLLSTFRGYD